MPVTVVGSIAFDAVKAPSGERERMLGGAATHFALAASFFETVHVVGPVGDDFTDADMASLATRGTDVSDVERVAGGKSFFWKGEYGWDLDDRQTLDTQLNVFEHFEPKLSDASKASDVLFLANIQPDLQLEVRRQCQAAKFVAMDSMNLWIDIARDSLVRVIEAVDCVILNDAELRQLTERPNVLTAAREILSWGPKVVVAKQGGYGAALITGEDIFSLPAFPMETVVDPTGAGDTFAGGFVGFVARHVDGGLDRDVLRNAMAYGTALASYNVEEFGTERVQRLRPEEIHARVSDLAAMTRFDPPAIDLRAGSAANVA